MMPRLVERGLHVEHGLLGRLQHRVEAAQHGHRQDDVAVLAAHVEVAQHVVGDAPDEVGDPVELALFHVTQQVAGSRGVRRVAPRPGSAAARSAARCKLFLGHPGHARAVDSSIVSLRH